MNYYNEFDKKAAAWLRELIRNGLIPEGDVDERSITEVRASDLRGYTQCHFFAGIGGWSLALQLAQWPSTEPVWTGSCPCQPFSVAGKGRGTEDERHLWPVFRELIRACKPPTVFGEQVASKAGRDWLAGVFADLEGMAYQRAGADLCAAGVGAPHIRQRLFWVADAYSKRCSGKHPLLWSQDDRRQRQEKIPQAAGSGSIDGMAHSSSSEGLERREEQLARREQPTSERGGDADGIPNSDSGRCEQQHQNLRSLPEFNQSSPPFWPSSRTIQCRDGKVRRIPVEPILQRVAHGIPFTMDSLRDIVVNLKTEITKYASQSSRDTCEVVREMQYAFWSGAIQWEVGGRIGLLSPEILLAALFQLERELGVVKFCSSQDFISIQEAIVRRVRENPSFEAAACSPHRWQYAQQLTRKFADSLYELPHEDSLGAAQNVFDRPSGFPLALKCVGRVGLLRGYGNAIVPQVAAEFIAAYLESV